MAKSQKLPGPISTRLRKLFKAGDPVWTPVRPADVPARRGKVPKGVVGEPLGGRHRRGKS